MIILMIVLLLSLLCALAYIVHQRWELRRTYRVLNSILDRAIAGEVPDIPYDESLLSFSLDKLLRYTEANRVRMETVQADRGTIKSLISDISHQTKTPLANILLYSSLLAERTGLGEEDRRDIREIHTQAEKLRFLIDALMKMSRLETGLISVRPEPAPLRPMLESVLSKAKPEAERKNITISLDCGEAVQAAFDPRWTEEALFNLVDNGIKYTPEGGKIRVSVTALELFVKISVRDNGVGIPQEEVNRIFQRFYRSPRTGKQEGIGVGLFLAREIIRLQEGYIRVTSKPDEGSDFSVFLPKI